MALPLSAFAQNVQRLEEEQELDKVRKQRVDEIIQERRREEEQLRKEPITLEQMDEQHLVEVEPSNILPPDLSSTYALVPYSVRRSQYGLEVGLSYSMFEPINYKSSFAEADILSFDDLYGTPQLPMIEFYMNGKYNFALGSIGAELAYGMYRNDVTDTSFGEDISLSLQVVRIGAKYVMDNLFFEPIFAPYVGGGVYTVLYKESAASNSYNGNTQLAPYVFGGILMQLNWIDKAAAVESYTEAGIENTYLFAEARQYTASSAVNDPDFSTDITLSGGMSIEF